MAERLRYTGVEGLTSPVRRIQYAGRGRPREEDDPLSPAFVPPQARDERQAARWWALHGRRTARPSSGEFDPT